VTPAQNKKLAATLQEKLVELLGPLGIEVKHELTKHYSTIAEYTFRIPDQDKSKVGVYTELTTYLEMIDANACEQDPKHLEHIKLTWARMLANEVPNLFDNSPLPAAEEIDWRPNETIPEDFGAA